MLKRSRLFHQEKDYYLCFFLYYKHLSATSLMQLKQSVKTKKTKTVKLKESSLKQTTINWRKINMANIETIIESIKEMTVLELNDLVKAIEEEFGVTAAAPVAAAGGGEAAAAEEQTEFDVELASAGSSKIKVIKV